MERRDDIRARLAGISDPMRLLEGIFAYAPFGLQVYRADGHCLLTNKAFRELFGSEPPPEYNVLHDDIAERRGLTDLVRRAFAGETVQTPTFWYDPRELQQVRVTEGRRVAVSITMMPLFGPSGAVEHVALVIKDQTEETTARERAEAARADAEEAARVRQDFLSIAGHELKTPLTSVLLNLRSLEKALRTGPLASDARLTAKWDSLARQIGRLEGLVDQLLDVSRITAGKLVLAPEPLDLVQVAREVAERFSAGAEGSAIEVRARSPAPGEWDRLRIEQILTNLLSNAVKYGEGRPISIEVAITESGVVRQASFEVRDRGIGIPPDEIGRIFGRFERGASERDYGGLGLGLWIVRQMVDAMGGTIAVESTPGLGSTFTVRLPCR